MFATTINLNETGHPRPKFGIPALLLENCMQLKPKGEDQMIADFFQY